MIYEELKAIQRQYGYLPADQLEMLAQKIQVPLYRLHGIASFYPHFFLSPPAKAEVRICTDMACHLNGARDLCRVLKAQFQGCSEKEVSIRNVSCLGQCDGAPAISLNDQIYSRITLRDAESLVRGALAGERLPHPHSARKAVALASDPYPTGGRYGALRRLVETRDWAGVIATLKASQLRGLGGAGFPTGAKWELVRDTPSQEKYVVCNADESEPGTFKDRHIMENIPHLVVEGMIIAGLVVGARKGILYIRHEYEAPKAVLEEEIQRCQRADLLGRRVLGSDHGFEIEIFTSPGGYICGEESALLEALEGKRAEPRNKPPFPGTHGLWNQPTLINNVETFANVPLILAKGVEWYRAQGRAGNAGLKFIGVSGHVRSPGVFEVPMGTPVSELIFRHAGGLRDDRKLKAFAPSGPSSGYLPASLVDVPLDFKSLAAVGSMLGSGALVVCDESACMLDMALNATTFFRNESCGKCVPCRMGSQKIVDMLTGWTRGKSSPGDLELINELSDALRLASICGLGQVVPAPIVSVLRHFRDEVEAHFERQCPSGVCPMDAGRRA
ncbi:MAG TPA: NAD(P)H-dependent oxidoreductase subunit E [Candidatus Acidoferrales bacterium]|nr:NAD(P)H-dependent oxidoreductase subunit E [Candidatus Acidoferrales bacterium]